MNTIAAPDSSISAGPIAEGPSPLISIREAGRVYRMGEVDVHALRGATLDIHEGDFLIVIGASGSGKSTLLNLIGGMDRPTSGEVLYLGRDLGKAGDRELTTYRRREVGFVFQFYNLIPTLTAVENIQVATEVAENPLDAMEALRLVDMEDRADHFPSQLSGGQQQRVAMARALAGNPRMLLCDEPTGALDSESASQVLSLLARLSGDLGKTVILITHNPAIPQIGRRTARLHDGRIVSIETNPKQIPPSEIDW